MPKFVGEFAHVSQEGGERDCAAEWGQRMQRKRESKHARERHASTTKLVGRGGGGNAEASKCVGKDASKCIGKGNMPVSF